MRKSWAWAVMGSLGLSSAAWGTRPLITDDAYPLEKGKFQLEAGVAYVREGLTNHFEAPVALRYGLAPGLEVGVGSGAQSGGRENESDGTEFAESVSDLGAGAKWKVLDQEKFIFSQALLGEIRIPTADEDEEMGSGEVDYLLKWILSRQFTERLAVDFNLGYTWVGHEDDSDVLGYSVAGTYQLTERWQPVAEIVFETPVEGGKTSAGVNGGIRWLAAESLVLDAAVGGRVAGDWPEWTATVGLTWVF